MDLVWAIVAAIAALNIVGFLGALAFVKLNRRFGRRG